MNKLPQFSPIFIARLLLGTKSDFCKGSRAPINVSLQHLSIKHICQPTAITHICQHLQGEGDHLCRTKIPGTALLIFIVDLKIQFLQIVVLLVWRAAWCIHRYTYCMDLRLSVSMVSYLQWPCIQILLYFKGSFKPRKVVN